MHDSYRKAGWTVLVAILSVLTLTAAKGGEEVRGATVDVLPDESWQFDWSWREMDVPLTTHLRPHLTAFDAAGQKVWDRDVGKGQQKVYDPKDLNIQKWRVYAVVGEKVSLQQGGYFSALYTVRLPSSTRKVRMSVWRYGDTAEISEVEMVGAKCRKMPTISSSFPQMSEKGIQILSDVDLDAHLVAREKAVPRLLPNGDRTELVINGKPIIPRIYKGSTRFNANRYPTVSNYSRKGFNVFTVGFNLAETANPDARATAGIWRADGTPDVEKIRGVLREYLRRAPDSYLMLAFGVAPYNGWGEKHPGEIFRNEKGGYGIFRGARVVAFRDAPTFNYAKDERPAFSYASEEFADEASAFIEKLFAAIEKMPEGKAVIGAYACGGTDGQWLDLFDNSVKTGFHQCGDYSDVMKRRFAAYRRMKRGPDAVVTIPSSDALWDRQNQFYGEHEETVKSDYRRFMAEVATEFRLKISRAIKRGSGGRVLVGSYSPAGGLEGFPLIAETHTQGLLESADYDFFAVVPNYMREHVDPVVAAIYDGSCIRRGKLYVSELDLRCSEVRNWGFWGSDFWVDNHSLATFRRKALYFAANALTHGGTYHFYDMDGGWFAGKGAQEVLTKVNDMAEAVRPMPLAPERIALVGGEKFYDFQSFGKHRVVPYFMREQPRSALAFAGVPWNQYLLEEILARKEAELPKVVIFTDLTTTTHAEFEELKRRYARDGRVLVYMWRPGVFSPDGAKIEQQLGIKASPGAYGKLGFADGSSADSLMRGVGGLLVPTFPYYYIEYAPVMTPDASAGWKTLATFKGTDIAALGVRRSKDYTEVYTSFPGGVTPAFCRNLVREAKERPLVESNEISGYGSGLFYLVAQSDGKKRFRLPRGVRPEKVLEGPPCRSDGDDYYAIDLRRGDIFVLTVK